MAEMNLIEQAASILGTIRATLKDGKILATEEEVQKRAAVCLGCDKLKEKRVIYSCVTCGCGFKRKIAVSGSSCPLGKW